MAQGFTGVLSEKYLEWQLFGWIQELAISCNQHFDIVCDGLGHYNHVILLTLRCNEQRPIKCTRAAITTLSLATLALMAGLSAGCAARKWQPTKIPTPIS